MDKITLLPKSFFLTRLTLARPRRAHRCTENFIHQVPTFRRPALGTWSVLSGHPSGSSPLGKPSLPSFPIGPTPLAQSQKIFRTDPGSIHATQTRDSPPVRSPARLRSTPADSWAGQNGLRIRLYGEKGGLLWRLRGLLFDALANPQYRELAWKQLPQLIDMHDPVGPLSESVAWQDPD